MLGADHEAPTAPTGLEAEAVDARRVDLSWTPATDNRGVTNYEIYRDGTAAGDDRQRDELLGHDRRPADRRYEYTVKALDAAVNRSPASNAASVTTPPAPLTTLTFTPVADTRVEDGMPSANFGSSIKLQSGGGVPKRESYLRFQLAGITGPVVEAKLRMQSTTDGTKNGPALHGAGGGWNETELAWSNRPSHDPTPAHDYGAIPKGTVAMYNAESLVNGNGLVNMALISDFNDSVDFGSREHTDVAVAAAADRDVRLVGQRHAAADGSRHAHRRGSEPHPGQPVVGRRHRQRRRRPATRSRATATRSRRSAT